MFHYFTVLHTMFNRTLALTVAPQSLLTQTWSWITKETGWNRALATFTVSVIVSLYCKESMALCSLWDLEALLSTLILWERDFKNHLFTVWGKVLRGHRSVLGHSYHHNPGAFLSMYTLHVGETPQRLRHTLLGAVSTIFWPLVSQTMLS